MNSRKCWTAPFDSSKTIHKDQLKLLCSAKRHVHISIAASWSCRRQQPNITHGFCEVEARKWNHMNIRPIKLPHNCPKRKESFTRTYTINGVASLPFVRGLYPNENKKSSFNFLTRGLGEAQESWQDNRHRVKTPGSFTLRQDEVLIF